MTTCISRSHVAAYVSGMALGAIVLVTAVAPHLKLDGFSLGQTVAACAGRLTPDQADGLRSAVLNAEAKRDGLIGGVSAYAAAKIGAVPDQADAAAVKAADAAAIAARARFAEACV
jgi:hypothetical protein